MWKLKRSRAQQNEKNFRKWLQAYQPARNKQKIQLVRVFTARNGQNLYVSKNIGHITRERAIRIEESLLTLEYGVKRDEVIERMEKIKKLLESFPFQKFNPAALEKFQKSSLNEVGDLIYRMNHIQHEDLLINAGMYMLYIDMENPYIIDEDAQQRKFELIKTDEEVRDFFLTFTETALTALATGSKESSKT